MRGIWEASPYRTWKIAGIPLVTIGAVLYLAFILAMLYYSFIEPTTRVTTGKSMILFVGAWIAGIIWYFVWRPAARSRASTSHHLRRAAAGVTRP